MIEQNNVISEWKETKNLKNQLNRYVNAEEKEYKKELENQIFGNKGCYEYFFRRRLKKEFEKSYKAQYEKKLTAYQYMMKSEWSFIAELYPSATTEKKSVFILSSAKFFEKNDPIINPSYNFTEKSKIEKAIVIIDEFDDIKNSLAEKIINDNLKLDVIDIYTKLRYRLTNLDDIDNETLSIRNQKGRSCKELLEECALECEEIKKKFFPNNFRTKLVEEYLNGYKEVGNNEYILSYKGVFAHPVVHKGRSYSFIPYCEENIKVNFGEKINLITEYKKARDNQYVFYPVWLIVKNVKRFVNKIFRTIYFIAMDYMNLENKKRKEKHGDKATILSKDSALTSIISHLNITNNHDELHRYEKYIKKAVEPGKYIYDNPNYNKRNDKTVYANGLYYTCVYNHEITIDNSRLYNYEMYTTPETLMLNLCTYAHVIGVSATAEVPSVSNFNVEYLDEQLRRRNSEVHILENKYVNQLEMDYAEKTVGYNKYNIETRVLPINIDGYSHYEISEMLIYLKKGEFDQNAAINLAYDKDIGNKIINLDRLKASKDETSYSRLCKVWIYLKDVLTSYKVEGKISTGIIVTNQGLKFSNDEFYTMENIQLGANLILQGLYNDTYKEAEKKVKDMFVFVNAEKLKALNNKDLDSTLSRQELERVVHHFKENKPIFLVTTFNSVGRGNNLQVKVETEIVKEKVASGLLYEINEIFGTPAYMDWDSVYVEKPSFIIPNINDLNINFKSKECLKTLFCVEDICEREKITSKDKFKIIKNVFMTINEPGYNNDYKILYGKASVKNAYTVKVYQTIGRIARTNVKKQYNAIYYDYNMLNYIETDEAKLNLDMKRVTHEFAKFRDAIKIEQCNVENEYKENTYENFSLVNTQCKNFIYIFLAAARKNGWNRDYIEFWETLRVVLLQHPVVKKNDMQRLRAKFDKFEFAKEYNFDIEMCYVCFKSPKNQYVFCKKEDEIYVSKDNKKNKNKSNEYPFEVSKYDSRLYVIDDDKDLYEYFSEKGYATNWDNKAKYMMCPYVYQSIYKGAIGEEIIKAVFEKKCGYKILNINEEAYEKFDFLIDTGKHTFFVDAKNISEKNLYKNYANNKLKEKLLKKVACLNVDLCFVINVVDEKGDKSIFRESNICVVPGVYYVGANNKFKLKYSTETEKVKVLDEIRNIIENYMEE